MVVDGALQRARGRTDAFAAKEQRVEVVGSRYIDWLIPGLLGMNIMGTGMWGIGFSLVVARSKRMLKRLAATPMSRAHYLLAQLLARLVFLVLEVGALLLFGWLAFGVPIRGSIVTLAVVAMAGSPVVRRPGAVHRGAAADDRGGVRLDELRHAADVGVVRRLLLVGALPIGGAAVHQGAAADGAERRRSAA